MLLVRMAVMTDAAEPIKILASKGVNLRDCLEIKGEKHTPFMLGLLLKKKRVLTSLLHCQAETLQPDSYGSPYLWARNGGIFIAMQNDLPEVTADLFASQVFKENGLSNLFEQCSMEQQEWLILTPKKAEPEALHHLLSAVIGQKIGQERLLPLALSEEMPIFQGSSEPHDLFRHAFRKRLDENGWKLLLGAAINEAVRMEIDEPISFVRRVLEKSREHHSDIRPSPVSESYWDEVKPSPIFLVPETFDTEINALESMEVERFAPLAIVSSQSQFYYRGQDYKRKRG